MTNNLIIYSTPTCVTCRAIMRKLDADGIKYSKVDVTEDTEAAERLKRNGYQQVPVLGWAGTLHSVDALPNIRKQIISDRDAQ